MNKTSEVNEHRIFYYPYKIEYSLLGKSDLPMDQTRWSAGGILFKFFILTKGGIREYRKGKREIKEH